MQQGVLFIAVEQIRQLGVKAEILPEPVGRSTASTIALAAFEATANGDDPLLLVIAADHVIQSEVEFRSVVRSAQSLCRVTTSPS